MKIAIIWLCLTNSNPKNFAKQLAMSRSLTNKPITAFLLNPTAEQEDFASKSNQINKVVCCRTSQYYIPERDLAAIYSFAKKENADLYLFGDSFSDNELAPRLAFRLNSFGVVAADKLAVVSDGLEITRGCFGQNLQSTFVYTKHPLCITLSKSIEAPVEEHHCHPNSNITHVNYSQDDWANSRSLVPKETNPLINADLVLVGGRGIGSKDQYDKLEKIAKKLGGELAATRPVILNGWGNIEQMVGQSGHTIAPKVLITFGVSGSAAFLSGVKRAEKIISINKDPLAPIFRVSNYGLVEDVASILDYL